MYIYLTQLQTSSDFRFNMVNSGLLISPLLKNYIIQLISAFDAGFGISLLLKVIFSIQQIRFFEFLPSVLFALFLTSIFRSNDGIKDNNDSTKSILLGASFVFLLSSGVYALTGGYPQITFGLGNRVTIYVSFLFVVLLIFIVKHNSIIFTVFLVVFSFSVFGLSSHWKHWNNQQMELYSFIQSNKKSFSTFNNKKLIFVKGMQYSQLGELNHIDFLSTSSASPFFTLALGYDISVIGINQNFIIKQNTLYDTKFSRSYPINNSIVVFDTENYSFQTVMANDLPEYIGDLPRFKRHWASLDGFEFVINLISKINPNYAKSL